MKKHYRKAERICTFRHLLRELESQGYVIWQPTIIKGRWKHLVNCWKANLLMGLIKNGCFWEAREIKRRGK